MSKSFFVTTFFVCTFGLMSCSEEDNSTVINESQEITPPCRQIV